MRVSEDPGLLAAALFARRDIIAAIRVLNAVGIEPMPLKGVLLQHVVYGDPAERLISDADIAVPPRCFERAIAAFRAGGYRIDVEGQAGASVKGPRARLEIDVHHRFFLPGLFALGTGDLFARGTIDRELFGASVVLPEPCDLYAHLVGNFAKGRHAAEDHAQVRDFGAVARRFALTPDRVAEHLERHGLARAARYALPHAEDAGDAFAGRVLRALRNDSVGTMTAAGARAITRHFGGSARASLVAPHLVNTSIARGTVSLVVHLAFGIRSRLAYQSRRSPSRRTART